MDGVAAAYAAWLKYGDRAQFIAVFYGQQPPAMPPGAEVLIVDFSYPRETMERLKQQHPKLFCIDHHKTAQAALEGLDYAKFDMYKCGAVLTWEHLHTEPVPRIFEYVQDYDLWKFALPDSKAVTLAMQSYPFTLETWKMLHHASIDDLRTSGKIMLAFQDTIINGICKHARWEDVGGHKIITVNSSAFLSEVGHVLLERYPTSPFSACWFRRFDGKEQWSLRSRPGGPDVSQVAKLLGGGGHAAAAGFVRATAFNTQTLGDAAQAV
jgi:hypothetical protein